MMLCSKNYGNARSFRWRTTRNTSLHRMPKGRFRFSESTAASDCQRRKHSALQSRVELVRSLVSAATEPSDDRSVKWNHKNQQLSTCCRRWSRDNGVQWGQQTHRNASIFATTSQVRGRSSCASSIADGTRCSRITVF